MRIFFRFVGWLFLILLLAAAGWGGYYGYQLWCELNKVQEDCADLQAQLTVTESTKKMFEAESTRLLAESTRLRSENDRLLAESFHVREENEKLTHQVTAMAAECDQMHADLRRQSQERANAEKALRAELERTRAHVKTVERERDTARQVQQAEERELGVATLKELVELTDKAPRKKTNGH